MYTINKLKNGFYSGRVQIDVGYNANGKRARVNKTIKTCTKNRNEAERITAKYEQELLTEYRTTGAVVNRRVTFRDYSTNRLEQEYKTNRLADSTYTDYMKTINFACEFFGDKNINAVNGRDIQRFLDDRLKKCVASTVSQDKTKLHRIFKLAYNDDLITINPVSKATVKAAATNEKTAFTREELQIMRKDLANETPRKRALFALLLNTGARIGEITALTWQDIDIENRLININKSVTREAETGNAKVKTTKTGAGRVVPVMADNCINALKEWKAEQARYILSVGGYYKNNNLVFPNKDGTQARSDKVRQEVTYTARVHGWDFAVNPHKFRHTAITTMITNGVDIVTAGAVAGHTSKLTTLRYAHTTEESIKNAMQTLAINIG